MKAHIRGFKMERFGERRFLNLRTKDYTAPVRIYNDGTCEVQEGQDWVQVPVDLIKDGDKVSLQARMTAPQASSLSLPKGRNTIEVHQQFILNAISPSHRISNHKTVVRRPVFEGAEKLTIADFIVANVKKEFQDLYLNYWAHTTTALAPPMDWIPESGQRKRVSNSPEHKSGLSEYSVKELVEELKKRLGGEITLSL